MALEVNVNLDPDAVNKHVAEAILDSALGENLKKAIGDEITRLSQHNHYSGPSNLERVVQQQVGRIITALLESDPIRSQIEAAVREIATEDVLRDLSRKAWDSLVGKLER